MDLFETVKGGDIIGKGTLLQDLVTLPCIFSNKNNKVWSFYAIMFLYPAHTDCPARGRIRRANKPFRKRSSVIQMPAGAPAALYMAGSGVQDVLEAEYAQWLEGQERIIVELGRALRAEGQGSSQDDETLAQAVHRAVQRYHDFTGTAAVAQRQRNLVAWPAVSAVERVFMWMGSLQRPSTAFQLLYALMGHQIQTELEQLLELENADDGRPASLASLSALQLSQLNKLQTSTVEEEDRIERETAKWQQSLADQPFKFSGEFTRAPTLPSWDEGSSTTQDNSVLGQKVAALQELRVQADALRQSTFDKVLELLHTAYQKAQFLLAFAKLQVALRRLGRNNVPPLSRGV
ncbi:hypothetical protein GOP47_0029511 [Adiantum capillus-veneris]|nr:hypothetical protein GOP47_0029511 [Adiantum capillus-veneris]